MESKGLIYIDLCYDNLKLDIIMKPSTQIQGATKQVIFCKYMKTPVLPLAIPMLDSYIDTVRRSDKNPGLTQRQVSVRPEH